MSATTGDVVPTGEAAIAMGKAAGLSAYPTDFIPPSLLPGYIPDNRGPTIAAVCLASMSVAFLFACSRLLARMVVFGSLGLDDWMMVPATVSEIAVVDPTNEVVLMFLFIYL